MQWIIVLIVTYVGSNQPPEVNHSTYGYLPNKTICEGVLAANYFEDGTLKRNRVGDLVGTLTSPNEKIEIHALCLEVDPSRLLEN